MNFSHCCNPQRSSIVKTIQITGKIAAVLSAIAGGVWAAGCSADAGIELPFGDGGDSTVGNEHKGESELAGRGAEGSGGSKGTGGKTSANNGDGGRLGTGGSVNKAGGANSGGSTNRGGSVGGGGRRPEGSAGGDAAAPVGSGGSHVHDGGGAGGGGKPTADSGAPRTDGSSGAPSPLKKFFGNIDTRGAIRSDFKTMWDQFSPENAGKWGEVERSEGSYNWKTLDAMYKYTQDNGIFFKEHTFCWGQQQPTWVNNNNGEKAVKAWMKAFCDRYPATAMIDVFNESLHNSPAYKNGIGGTGSSGYDWIANTFKWAKEACPKAILLYNDYNTIEYANENGGVIKLVNAIKSAGAPIDGVGCQAHDVAKVSTSTVLSYVQKIIKETGLPVYITEMDIGVADNNKQLQIMKDIVTPLWTDDNVKGFTYWGYIQGATWRSDTGLMSDSGTKRPALTWLMEFLGR